MHLWRCYRNVNRLKALIQRHSRPRRWIGTLPAMSAYVRDWFSDDNWGGRQYGPTDRPPVSFPRPDAGLRGATSETMKIFRSLMLVALAVAGLATVSGCGWHRSHLFHHSTSHRTHNAHHYDYDDGHRDRTNRRHHNR